MVKSLLLYVLLMVASAAHSESHDRPLAPPPALPDATPSPRASAAIGVLQELFPWEKSVLEGYYQKTVDMLRTDDDPKAAEHLVALSRSVSDSRLDDILRQLRSELSRSRINLSIDEKEFLLSLKWTIEELLKRARGVSAREERFKNQIAGALTLAKEREVKQKELFDKASKGDAAAREALLKQAGGGEALLSAAKDDPSLLKDTLKILSWKDKDGNHYLDVKAEGKNETWSLGADENKLTHLYNNLSRAANGDVRHADQPARPWERDYVTYDLNHRDKAGVTPAQKFREEEEVCRAPRSKVVQSVPTAERPKYFFRPFPSSDRAVYAGENGNHLIDFASGAESPVPGSYDGVPTPDEVFITVPRDGEKITGLTFYPTDDLAREMGTPRKFVDEDMAGVYQSVGVLETDGMGKRKYRAIVTSKSGDIKARDYEYTPDPMSSSLDIKALGNAHTLCGNLKQNAKPAESKRLALPMLSKDGKYLAALDVEEMVTKIYSVSDNGDCSVRKNLGIYTGKVEFDFNSSRIVFHKFNNENRATDWVDYPSDNLVSNIYMYDLASNEMTRVTNNVDSNAVYPSFRRDGSVVYLSHPKGIGDRTKEPSQLVVADPSTGARVPFNYLREDSPERERMLNARVVLGDLWSRLCSPFGNEVAGDTALVSTFGLAPNACRKMVENFGKGYLSDLKRNPNLAKVYSPSGKNRVTAETLKGVTTDDLLKECGKATKEPKPTSSGRVRTAPEIFRSCNGCHGTSAAAPAIDWSAANLKSTKAKRRSTMSLAEDLLKRLREPPPNRMPPGMPLTEEEIKVMEEYLK